jgi:hypothetical protein
MQTETCRAACSEFHVVGDHKHRGSASGFFCENICHDPPQCIIECTGSFVHNEDRTPQLKCSDECKALLLATAEVCCAFVEEEAPLLPGVAPAVRRSCHLSIRKMAAVPPRPSDGWRIAG